MKNKLDKNALKILFSVFFFRSGWIITKTFLVLYILRLSESTQTTTLFYTIFLCFHFLSFAFFWAISKSAKRDIIQSISIIGTIITYIGLIIIWENIIDYAYIFALSQWIFSGMYRVTHNNKILETTNNHNRGNYFWLNNALKNIGAISVPFFIGAIISINFEGKGYEIAFLIGIVLYILSFITQVKLPQEKKEVFDFKEAIKLIKKDKNLSKVLSITYFINFIFSAPLFTTIIPLLLFSYGIKEFGIGSLSTIFTLFAILASYVFWKFVHYKSYKLSMKLAWFLYIFLIIVLLVFPNNLIFIIFSSLVTFLSTFMKIPFNTFSYNILHQSPYYKKIQEEYFIIQEFLITLGSLSAFVILFFIGNLWIIWVKVLFWSIALWAIISIVLFNSIDEKKLKA